MESSDRGLQAGYKWAKSVLTGMESVFKTAHFEDLPTIDLAGPSTAVRKRMAKAGTALPDGSFPIATKDDVRKAVAAFGRANPAKRAAVKARIIKRARQLGAMDAVPDKWVSS